MRPITRFFCKNWGSVVAGSFLNAFLNLICIIFDLFRVRYFLYSVILKVNVVKLEHVVDVFVVVAAV